MEPALHNLYSTWFIINRDRFPWTWPGKGWQVSYFNQDGRVPWIWKSCAHRLIQKSCLISFCCSISYCLTFPADQVYHSLLDKLPLWGWQFVLTVRVPFRFDGWRFYCLFMDVQENVSDSKRRNVCVKTVYYEVQVDRKSHETHSWHMFRFRPARFLCHGNCSPD
jgi:hypothetical protein